MGALRGLATAAGGQPLPRGRCGHAAPTPSQGTTEHGGAMPNVQVERRASRRARRRTTWLAGVALATTALLVPAAGATGRNGSAASVDPPPQPAGPIATWGQKADVEG